MPHITDIPGNAWSDPVEIEDAPEIWQVHAGTVFIHFVAGEAVPESPTDGLELTRRDAIRLEVGEIVQLRRAGPSAASITRQVRAE